MRTLGRTLGVSALLLLLPSLASATPVKRKAGGTDARPASRVTQYNHSATARDEKNEHLAAVLGERLTTQEHQVPTELGTVLVLQRRREKIATGESQDFLLVPGVIQGTRSANADTFHAQMGDRITDVVPISKASREEVQKKIETQTGRKFSRIIWW
jgi:hypothetical protein